LNIVGQDLDTVQKYAEAMMEKLKTNPALQDPDLSSRPGKPEFQVKVDLPAAQRLGVTSAAVGRELRAQVEGLVPAVYRENGLEYDVRIRLRPDQRDLEENFNKILIPNMNERLV